jgi:hypothetical protein
VVQIHSPRPFFSILSASGIEKENPAASETELSKSVPWFLEIVFTFQEFALCYGYAGYAKLRLTRSKALLSLRKFKDAIRFYWV